MLELALTPVLRVLVQRLLPHLPVNQRHHPRLPPRYHSRLHAQSVDPICSVFCGRWACQYMWTWLLLGMSAQIGPCRYTKIEHHGVSLTVGQTLLHYE